MHARVERAAAQLRQALAVAGPAARAVAQRDERRRYARGQRRRHRSRGRWRRQRSGGDRRHADRRRCGAARRRWRRVGLTPEALTRRLRAQRAPRGIGARWRWPVGPARGRRRARHGRLVGLQRGQRITACRRMDVVVRRPRQLREQRYHQQGHEHRTAHRRWSALARRGSRRAGGRLRPLCGHGASLKGLLKKAPGHGVGHGRFTMPSGDKRHVVRLVPSNATGEVAGVRPWPHVLCRLAKALTHSGMGWHEHRMASAGLAPVTPELVNRARDPGNPIAKKQSL